MNDFISKIAGPVGMDGNTVEKGIGALLATVKQHASQDVFSDIANTVPGADTILSKFQSLPERNENNNSSGYLEMAVGLLTGKSEQISTLLSMFSKGGFSLDMIKRFLPVVFGYFKNNGSGDVVEKIGHVIPGLDEIIGSSDSSDILSKVSKFF